jgi:hypothetical protein
MEQSMGLGSAALEQMLENPEKNRKPLGKMYVKTKAQWEGLVSGVGLDREQQKNSLDAQLAALAKYRPSTWRWFY